MFHIDLGFLAVFIMTYILLGSGDSEYGIQLDITFDRLTSTG